MQANRIDSRARGNAPQMLDKYKKLAHEAQLNDDRVQTEYYLQFADHYFRVIADAKAQKDESQPRRSNERQDEQFDEDEDEDFREERKPRARNGQRPRRDDDEFAQGSEGESGNQADDDNPFVRADRDEERAKPKRKPRPARKPAAEATDDDDGAFDASLLPPAIARASENDAGEDAGEEKPKPRRGLKPRRKPREDSAAGDSAGDDGGALEAVG
ncbi:Eukaryotic translation initiation factor 3 subunit 10 [Erythrobacter sp. EC-HK427]|nr:Eukaryotic translation initiation factor 3 subunit 10 [Erythrobacter sp. EC-HK427]